ncbi:hypothetical protein GCM10009764_37750 [Nocardia ninae]|uniref:Uncharacterized protein n=1 Tax=Nocardia ninae NBRC 108245 TaxID=1210091 RepID=A0A511MSE2_9NOCA|nr:hypothetical protein NN4_76470 [Nocardia ninae NBRC 108245]
MPDTTRTVMRAAPVMQAAPVMPARIPVPCARQPRVRISLRQSDSGVAGGGPGSDADPVTMAT